MPARQLGTGLIIYLQYNHFFRPAWAAYQLFCW